MRDRTRDGIRTKQAKATEEAVIDKGTYGLRSDRCVAFIQFKVFAKPVSTERFCKSCKDVCLQCPQKRNTHFRQIIITFK